MSSNVLLVDTRRREGAIAHLTRPPDARNWGGGSYIYRYNRGEARRAFCGRDITGALIVEVRRVDVCKRCIVAYDVAVVEGWIHDDDN